MNRAQLRAFHAVATEGGFTRAAAALHVTQPTLSGQVGVLEENYGVKLFERRGRGIELTGLGTALFDVTRRLFAVESEAEQILSSAHGLASGNLRVGADAPYHVVPLLASFSRRYPGIRLSMTFGNSEHVLRELHDRRSDVAVLPDIRSDDRLYALPFRRDRLVIFVDRGHAWARRRSIRLEEIHGQKLVLREPGSTTRAIFERTMTKAKVTPGSILEIGSREAVREAVAAGLGIGVVFDSEFGRDDRLHRLSVRGAALQSMEFAVCLAERRQTRVVRAFFDLLQEASPPE